MQRKTGILALSVEERFSLAHWLGKTGCQEAYPLLVWILRKVPYSEPGVRSECFVAIAESGHPLAEKYLSRAATESKREFDRISAMRAISHLKSEEAIALLLTMAKSKNVTLRAYALEFVALMRIRDRSYRQVRRDLVLTGLRSLSPSLRSAAIGAAVSLKLKGALPLLQRLTSDSNIGLSGDNIQVEAVRAIRLLSHVGHDTTCEASEVN